MSYPTVEKFLTSTIGLDPESLGAKAVGLAVNKRMRIVGVNREDEYLSLLKSSRSEQANLVESVVVPETWFFRDQGPFDYLRKYVRQEWKPANKAKVLRILSVPCSTGEEPLSIAITLLEAGLGKNDFKVDAVDISIQALEAARGGVYGKKSFRGKDESYRKRYFEPTEQGWQIRDEIAQLVDFQQGNILAPDFGVDRSSYDIIFCRNLLIYMTQEAKRQILNNLDGLLLEGGLFFSGHTETMLVCSYGYLTIKHTRAFACKKTGRVETEIQKSDKVQRQKKIISLPKSCPRVIPAEAAKLPVYQEPLSRPRRMVPPDDPQRVLDQIRDLGDRGALEEAKAVCEKFLQLHRMDCEAYYLMGMLEEASNRYDAAEEWFMKALYLNPNHYPVLVQLYLLHGQKGNRQKAEAFRERAARVQALQSEEVRDR